MARIGVIAGTNFFGKKLIGNYKEKTIKTKHGNADVLISDKIIFIPRHGKNKNIPPHKINNKANIIALKKLGIKKIIGIGSSGSLKKIKLPAIIIPHDYINIWGIPTFYDSKIVHITPSLDEALRKKIIETAKKLKIKTINKGIYINTIGPRLETKAEINLLKNFGDIVGMTIAKEATLAKELNLSYAAIVSIDNYCHGIAKEKLTYKQIQKNAANNSNNIKRLLFAVLGT